MPFTDFEKLSDEDNTQMDLVKDEETFDKLSHFDAASVSNSIMRAAVNRMGGYGGGGYGNNMTLEILALLIGLAFFARILGDIIKRIRNGRSIERSFQEDLNIMTRNVLASLRTVEDSIVRERSVGDGRSA